LSGLAIGVFAGFLAGYFVGASHGGDAPAVAAAPAPAPAPPGPPRPNPLELQDRITAAKQVLAADPNNAQAWITLGNDYFDSQQAQNAVDAYARALVLAPGNPDVLTDQGVMYRQLQDYAKAVADFKLANRLDPKHLQSLFNLGIVYAADLKQPAEAVKAWNRIIATDPANPLAEQARTAIARLQQQP
jgi:cytochrome c-type biogenesis protein CcmH/NrfG